MSLPVLAPLELLQLEALEHFQLELVLVQQEPPVLLRRIRLRHNQCCCRKSCSRFQRHCHRRSCKSHSLVLEHCRRCMSHSLVPEHCRCCMSHSLELERCRCCMSHSLELERCMHCMSHSLGLEHCMRCMSHSLGLACSMVLAHSDGGGASCSGLADHSDALPRC